MLVVKNLPANARDAGSIPGLGRSPGRGCGNPPQYSCLENPRDRAAWQATVHRVKKSQTWLKRLSTHTYLQFFLNFSSREDVKKVQLPGPYQGLQDLTPGLRSRHFHVGTLLMWPIHDLQFQNADLGLAPRYCPEEIRPGQDHCFVTSMELNWSFSSRVIPHPHGTFGYVWDIFGWPTWGWSCCWHLVGRAQWCR